MVAAAVKEDGERKDMAGGGRDERSRQAGRLRQHRHGHGCKVGSREQAGFELRICPRSQRCTPSQKAMKPPT